MRRSFRVGGQGYNVTMNTCRNCERPCMEVYACYNIKAECLACCGCEDHDYTIEETEDY